MDFNSFTFQSNPVCRLASAARFQLVSGLALPTEVELVERKRMSAVAETPATRPRTHRAWSRERSILQSGSDVCMCYREILMYPPLSLMSGLFFSICVWVWIQISPLSSPWERQDNGWSRQKTASLVRLGRGSSVRDQCLSLSLFYLFYSFFAVKSRTVLPPEQQTESGVTKCSRLVLCSSSSSSSFQHLPFPLLHLKCTPFYFFSLYLLTTLLLTHDAWLPDDSDANFIRSRVHNQATPKGRRFVNFLVLSLVIELLFICFIRNRRSGWYRQRLPFSYCCSAAWWWKFEVQDY